MHMNMTDPSHLDGLLKQLEGNGMQEIAKRLNIAPEQADKAIRSALPELAGSIKDSNATEVTHSLMDHLAESGQHGVATIRSKIGAMFSGSGSEDSPPVSSQNGLGQGVMGLLGDRAEKVTQTISQASGLEPSKITALLGMIAPTVLGYMGKHAMDTSNLTETANSLKASANENVESLKASAQQTTEQIQSNVKEGAEQLKSATNDQLDTLKAKVTGNAEQMKESFSDSKESLGGKITHMLDLDGDGKVGMSDLIKAGNSLLGRNSNSEANNKPH